MANTGYEILQANDLGDLARQMTAKALTGWLPFGSMTIDPKGSRFYQTMVKGDVGGAEGTGDVYTLPAAGASLGGVLQGAAVADAVDETDVVAQLNALLASLRASGAIDT